MDSLLPKSKICSKCGEEKLLEEFSRKAKGKYGKASQCKLCCKQYRQDNKEKIAEQQKQYNQDNKEKKAEYDKQYHEANKEKRKQYCQENKEKIAEWGRQYREKNKEQINKRSRNRRKNDEQYRIRYRLSGNLRRHKRKVLKGIGKTKNVSILTYSGCTIEFMQEHLNSTKKPDWGDDLHIDHIIPSSLFDHTNEEEIKKCWNWRNLRYLPAEENLIKGDTLDMDLVKSYGIEDLLPVGVDK